MRTVGAVRFLPNAITALALSTGLTSVLFASQGKWMYAMWTIAISTILDSLDGPAARLLNSSSRVGAELDSLSDLSAFGLCPALLLYFWQTSTNHPGDDRLWIVWGSCLVYAVCTALRLARFNSLLDEDAPKPWAKAFFTGVPSPPGALLAMVPIIIWVQWGNSFATNMYVVSLWTIVVGLLMVSTLPTIALKSVRIPTRLVAPLIIVMVFALVAFFYQQRVVALIGIAVYVFHIPYAVLRYRHLSRHPELWEQEAHPRQRRRGRQIRLQVRQRRRTRVAGRQFDGTVAAQDRLRRPSRPRSDRRYDG
jgi:CDP-diacylglycerol--serine O-phosphatidyltransferase